MGRFYIIAYISAVKDQSYLDALHRSSVQKGLIFKLYESFNCLILFILYLVCLTICVCLFVGYFVLTKRNIKQSLAIN